MRGLVTLEQSAKAHHVPSRLMRLGQLLLTLRPSSVRFWLVCAVPSLPVIALFAYAAGRAWPLATHGKFVEGRVVALHCARSGGFRYRFTAGGRDLEDRGRASRLQMDCAALAVGAPVPVYYLPENPDIHMAAVDPRSVVRRYVIATVVGGLVVILGVAALLYTYPTWPQAWRKA